MQIFAQLIFSIFVLFSLVQVHANENKLNVYMWQSTPDPDPSMIRTNLEKLKAAYIEAAKNGAEVFVTPEMYLTGYGLRDLFNHHPSFMPQVESAIQELAELSKEYDTLLIVGHPIVNKGHGKSLFNGASAIHNGKVVKEIKKILLPTYSEFEDYRYFEPSPEQPQIIEHKGVRMVVMICEDWWAQLLDDKGNRLYARDPVAAAKALNPDLAISLSSSPYAIGKYDTRVGIHQDVARFLGVPFLYVNEGRSLYDSTIADGRSFALDRDGNEVVRLEAFADSGSYLDFDLAAKTLSHTKGPNTLSIEQNEDQLVVKAIVESIRRYAEITGMNKVVIGLSGGIDSSLSAALHVLALGPENVHLIAMPGPYSDEKSEEYAREQARMFGVPDKNFKAVSIVEPFDAMMKQMPHWAGGVAEENFQSRLRYDILLGESNAIPGSYVVSNGNRSELLMGYFTVGGDNEGARAVIMDLYKTQVYSISKAINEMLDKEFIHNKVINRPPSAELSEGQLDSDSLPDYETLLDPLLTHYFDLKLPIEDVAAKFTMMDPARAKQDLAWVYRIIKTARNSEHKRHQGPIIQQLNPHMPMDILSRRVLVGTRFDTRIPSDEEMREILTSRGVDLSSLEDGPAPLCSGML